MACLSPVTIKKYVNEHYPQYKVIVASPDLTDEQFSTLMFASIKGDFLFITKKRPVLDHILQE